MTLDDHRVLKRERGTSGSCLKISLPLYLVVLVAIEAYTVWNIYCLISRTLILQLEDEMCVVQLLNG